LRVVEELADEGNVPPVRVGIHTGPALASEGDWYGRTVNVAARLCAVAPGGEVMVSESTRRAAGEIPGVDWGERELHWLRNVSEPVGTYLVRPEPTRSAVRETGVGPGRRLSLGFLCFRNLTREATG
jgi:adenylate cyclase